MAYKIFPNLPLGFLPFLYQTAILPASHHIPVTQASSQVFNHKSSNHQTPFLRAFVLGFCSFLEPFSQICRGLFLHHRLTQSPSKERTSKTNLNLHPIHISYSPGLFFSIPLPSSATVCLIFYVTYFICSFYYILSEQCLAHNRSQINICQMNK